MNTVFTPIKLGSVQLKNRIIMAPLTRCRATEEHYATALMAEHYAQRASAGLLIAEATMISEGNSAFYREPGIYSAAHAEAWRQVTQAVHAKDGKIFLQIWHGGRACHPVLNQGKVPVSSSGQAINDYTHTPEGKKNYTAPRVLRTDEIADIVAEFRQAAIYAKLAGFDGVEVHGANGYLIDQFLRDGINQRDDRYGGSMENRARFLMEVLAAVTAVWGSDKVGLRLSPLNSFNSAKDSNPLALIRYLAQTLSPLNLAYLHLMRADFAGVQFGDVVSEARAHYQGNLITNMGYDVAEANAVIGKSQADAVAFGSAFIANPDLVARLQHGLPLAQPDVATFYTHDAKGYTDYPTYSAHTA
ncbi:alkene reductase [Alishewanella tabrizica]|uniref:Alkene reductase n=1 Tax=Alishewanella tabrizica TaxID=671278 RepID=A0ABQ2WJR9_9ALTE|nr:alkene reductase [Alishewanella tabrizica]GGW59024.1 alkene reductase [Alishewanella tabrizica]